MPALTIDEPPALPTSATSQMAGGGGGNPFSGMGSLLSGSKPPAPGPGANSSGALKSQIDAIKKVLESVIQASTAGKTFFSRASQMLDQGLAMESQQGPGSSANQKPEASAMGSPESMSKMPAPAFAG